MLRPNVYRHGVGSVATDLVYKHDMLSESINMVARRQGRQWRIEWKVGASWLYPCSCHVIS